MPGAASCRGDCENDCCTSIARSPYDARRAELGHRRLTGRLRWPRRHQSKPVGIGRQSDTFSIRFEPVLLSRPKVAPSACRERGAPLRVGRWLTSTPTIPTTLSRTIAATDTTLEFVRTVTWSGCAMHHKCGVQGKEMVCSLENICPDGGKSIVDWRGEERYARRSACERLGGAEMQACISPKECC
jgi:hypothetical protein